jgi:hypothetical protein
MAEGDKGFGQQDPSDSAGPFNELAFVIGQQISKLSTVKVVLVKAVDTGAKTVDVQPMVNQLDGENNATPHGTIFGIPYVVWQYGKNAVQADPEAGDIGAMMCADRDISAVKKTKAAAPPGSNRQYDAADGVYLGGILNDAPEQWVKFTDAGMEWHDKHTNNIVSNAAGISINGVVFNRDGQVAGNLPVTGSLQLQGSIVNLTGATYSGNIATSGEVTAGTIGLKAHHHTAQGAFAATTAAQP